VQTFDRLDVEALKGLGPEGFFWLDLEAPSDQELEELGHYLDLHPMAVEDSREFGQRPKLDEYGSYVQMVFFGAHQHTAERTDLVEVHLFISGSWVVSIHRHPTPALTELRFQFERNPHERPEAFVVYKILDALTDSYFPVLATIDEQIDAIEGEIVQAASEDQLQRIFRLRRTLVELRRVVTPQRDLLSRASDQILELPGLEPASRDYLRDVYDHLIRISDLTDSYRDLLSSSMDVYLSSVSNRVSDISRRLGILAGYFLPVTLITGFFGQNFGWLTRHIAAGWTFLVFGVGLQLVMIAVLTWFFRSRGYFSSAPGARLPGREQRES
jgi:magnesium transporter